MDFKYEENIPNAIATAILEYEKQSKKGKAHYNEISRRVIRLLGHKISERKLSENLTNMVKEKLLIRHDPTGEPPGKKGLRRVHFWLTEKGERKHNLKILGTDQQTEKCKRLYQLLIFFEEFEYYWNHFL